MQMPDQLPGEHPSLAFQPLERRVDLTALEYMDLEGEDAISVPEMNYWFTCPEGDVCFSWVVVMQGGAGPINERKKKRACTPTLARAG